MPTRVLFHFVKFPSQTEINSPSPRNFYVFFALTQLAIALIDFRRSKTVKMLSGRLSPGFEETFGNVWMGGLVCMLHHSF